MRPSSAGYIKSIIRIPFSRINAIMSALVKHFEGLRRNSTSGFAFISIVLSIQ